MLKFLAPLTLEFNFSQLVLTICYVTDSILLCHLIYPYNSVLDKVRITIFILQLINLKLKEVIGTDFGASHLCWGPRPLCCAPVLAGSRRAIPTALALGPLGVELLLTRV